MFFTCHPQWHLQFEFITCRYPTGSGWVSLYGSDLDIQLLTPTPQPVTISGSKEVSASWNYDSPNDYYYADVSSLGLPSSFNSLFVDGVRATRAREPDVGYYTIVSVDSETHCTAFEFSEGDISGSWGNLNDVEVCALLKWIQTRAIIASVDDENNIVTFPGSQSLRSWTGYDWDYGGPAAGTTRYWVENFLEGLDTEGEWYFNETTEYLYYKPLSGQSVAMAQFTVPVVQRLLYLDEASYVSFTGMSFVETDWAEASGYKGSQGASTMTTLATIQIDDGVGNGFSNNLVARTGGYATSVTSEDMQIVGNEFTDLGAGGILLPSTSSEGVRVSLNDVHDFGLIYHDAIGVLVKNVGYTRITNNQIYNGNYTGIQVGWTWDSSATDAHDNLVQENEVYDVMLELCDGGGIYLVGYQPGTVVQANVIHDVQKTSNHYVTSTIVITGVYLDQGSSGIFARGNLVYDTHFGLMVNHPLKPSSQPGCLSPCIVDSNIFVNMHSRAIAFYQYPNVALRANIFAWTEEPSGSVDLIYGSGSSSTESYRAYRCDENLYFTDDLATVNSSSSLAAHRAYGFDLHSIVDDPLFVDPDNGDYRIYENSPAIVDLGFAAPWLDPPVDPAAFKSEAGNHGNKHRSRVHGNTVSKFMTLDAGVLDVRVYNLVEVNPLDKNTSFASIEDTENLLIKTLQKLPEENSVALAHDRVAASLSAEVSWRRRADSVDEWLNNRRDTKPTPRAVDALLFDDQPFLDDELSALLPTIH